MSSNTSQSHRHWNNITDLTELPNVSGATVQDSNLVTGDIVYSTQNKTSYRCSDATLGAAIWESSARKINSVYVSDYTSLNAATSALSVGETLVVDEDVSMTTAISLTNNIEVTNDAQITIADANLTITSKFKCGRYHVFNYGGTGVVIFNSGAVDAIFPEWWGAKGDGITVDDTPVQEAMDAFEQLGEDALFCFGPGQQHVLNSTISFTMPVRGTVIAKDVTFLSNSNTVMFDINQGADFSNPNTTLRRMVTWHGGNFENTNVTKTASVALQCHLFRRLKITGCRFEGWWRGIEFAGKDTYIISDCYFFDNEYSIIHPSGLVLDSGTLPVQIMVSTTHFSSCKQSSISILERVISFRVHDCVFAGLKNKIHTSHSDGTAIARGITIRDCQFEQNDGTDPEIYIEDGGGLGTYGVIISGCNIDSNNAGWKGIACERVFGLDINGCVFNDGTGGATEVAIDLDDNTKDVRIAASNKFSNVATWLVLGSSFDRSRLVFEPSLRSTGTILTGYNGDAFSTGEGTVDMSSVLSDFPTETVPRGYHIAAQARDSGSAGALAGGALVRIKKNDAASDWTGVYIGLPGVTNNDIRGNAGFVPCDENGDIFVRRVATGTNTIDIWITVVGIEM